MDITLLEELFDVLDTGTLVFHLEDRTDDRSLRLVWCNGGASRATGTDVSALVGRKAVDAFPNIEESGTLAAYANSVRTGESRKIGDVEYGDDRIARSIFEVSSHPLAGDHVASVFRNITRDRRAIDTIHQQAEALLELSAPALDVWDGVVLVPLVGVLDTSRARAFTERLLNAIVASEARVAIIDVTGVPVIDTVVARHILSAVRAAEMLGARLICTGISPQTAVTIARQRIDTRGLRTEGDLKAGMKLALRLLREQGAGKEVLR